MRPTYKKVYGVTDPSRPFIMRWPDFNVPDGDYETFSAEMARRITDACSIPEELRRGNCGDLSPVEDVNRNSRRQRP